MLLGQHLLQLLQVKELVVAETGRAVGLLAVDARVAVFKAGDHLLALETLAGRRFCVLYDHALVVRLA